MMKRYTIFYLFSYSICMYVYIYMYMYMHKHICIYLKRILACNNKPIDKEYDRSKPSGAPFARRYLQKIFDAS